MEPVIQKFRTALGGFNRQDVQQYIAQTAVAHKQETAALREQLAQAEERRAQLEAALSGAEAERNSAAAETDRIRKSLEESTKTLTKLRGEQSEAESKLAAARGELERLRAQVAELAPQAESYAQLKSRVATVELEAHQKAQQVVDEAQAEADRLRADTKAWLEAVLAQYGEMRQGMDILLAKAWALSKAAEETAVLDEQGKELRRRGGLD